MEDMNHSTNKSGFALIATLSVMLLIVLLLVAMLSLASTTTRSQGNGRAQAEAQANAKMAMMLALGELQVELGPDRRVNGAAALDAEALPEHRQWLAVYDAWSAEETQRPDPSASFHRYLVSGERDALENLEAAKIPIAGESIEILGEGTLGDAADTDRVSVGLISVANQRGRYAWWISDENSKAKINAGRDLPDSVTPELLALQSADSAPGSGFRMVEALEDIAVTGRQPWEMGDDLRGKSLSLASADLLPGAVRPSLGKHFNDLSTVSYGLLTDVRNGRFQRDLSLFMERPHEPELQQPLYTVDGSVFVNFDPDTGSAGSLDRFSGITMEELWLYYNLYKEIDYSRPASDDDRVGRRPAGFPTLLSGNSRDAVIVDKFYPYKRRVYSQVKYMLSLAAVPGSEDGKYDLRIAIDPVVILWNPYNVALEYQTGGYTTVGFTGLPYIAEFTTPDGTVSVPFTSFFSYRSVNLIRGLVGRDHAIVLQPGESRVFSRVDGRGDSLSSGWRYTEGTLLNHASFPRNLEKKDSVSLTLKPASSGYVNYITHWFGTRGTRHALQSGTVILRDDTALGDLPTITTAQSITVGNVVDDKKIPHMLMSQHVRTETDNRTPSKPWIWGNPTVTFRITADDSLTARMIHQMEIQVIPVSAWENPHVQITPGNQGYWGGGVRADFGVPFFTLRSVPLVPIKSIASFQHSAANGFRRYWKDSPVFTGRREGALYKFPPNAESLDGHRYLAPLGSKLIGNSFSHPLIPADKTHHTVMAADDQDGIAAVPRPVADHAYLANAALWDSWYFSSLTPQTVRPFGSYTRSLQEVFDDFFPESTGEKPVPLPSARMMPYRSGDDAALRALVTGNSPSDDAYRKLAAHLMVDGAFNVNSTSVTAWKVMLGSLRGHATARLEKNNNGVSVRPADAGSTPVTGLLAANGELSEPSANTAEANQWNGFRALDDAEIEALATELVAEIKKRGPFLSLSDFVNRRLGSYGTDLDDLGLARQGTLQAAIEAAGLNGDLEKGFRALGAVAGAPFPDAGEGSRAAGIPGHISQADLLTPLGPALRARSDTFTIRTYGSATDKAGNVLAEAWCEAVVRRVPEYVDAADAADVPETELTSPVNRRFGRKFQIVGFRWLSDAEI